MPLTHIRSKKKLTFFLGKSAGADLVSESVSSERHARLNGILKIKLTQNSKCTLYSNTKESVGVFCAFSKGRPWNSSKTEYWFAFHFNQEKFLKQFKNKYLTFICGSSDVLLIPFNNIRKNLTKFDGKGRLHIHIFKEGNKYVLSSTGIELTSYIVRPTKKNHYISNLNPCNITDFWDFYLQNSVAIEDVLTAQIYRLAPFLSRSDREDLHQDVLLRMHRCNILGQYNPALASFNTYLTGHVYGYIMNWLKMNKQKHSWRVDGTQYHYTRTFVRSLNGLDEESPEDLDQSDMVEMPRDFEDQYDKKERVESVRKTTPQALQGLLNLLYVGLSKKEIAKNFKVSDSTIAIMADQIAKLNQKAAKVKAGKPCLA